ncbi:MAG TPA: hypothetical protein EYQ00_15785 [Dehalococcoidia bacterium]|nr:hypothetical protein [Dehalococcoidia bacterium]
MTKKKPESKRKTPSENKVILDKAWGYIHEVDYKVSLRWVFYRLLQDNFYTQKDDYKNKWSDLCAKARKNFTGGWRPYTLRDSGREVVTSDSATTAGKTLEDLPYYAEVTANIFEGAVSVPFLIFEASTMDGQFNHYAPGFDRAALRGDASVDHKWKIAKRIDLLAETYGLPVHVLYFGDYDPKGLMIPKSAMCDVREWADDTSEILYTRIGVNVEHAGRYELQEKLEKPGTYEWEALPAVAAGELIEEALALCVDLDHISALKSRAEDETEGLRSDIESALSGLRNAP